jgi:hypothetical protein
MVTRKSLDLGALMGDMSAPKAEPAKEASASPAAETVEARGKKPAYRAGKRAFTAWANEEAYAQLRHMAIDRKTTVQALLEEGMDLLFRAHGYSEIARSKAGGKVGA